MSCQAARDTSRFDGLIDLFEYLSRIFYRLEFYTEIRPSLEMTELIVKIMVHLLSVLALATKKVKRGLLSKWSVIYTLPAAQFATEKLKNKLLGDTEMGDALQRLNRLARDDFYTTFTRSSPVGSKVALLEVLDGRQCLRDRRQIFNSGLCSIRQHGFNGSYSSRSGWVSIVA